MEIQWNGLDGDRPRFSTLVGGQVFRRSGSDTPCLAFGRAVEDEGGESYNAVEIESGMPVSVHGNTKVVIIDGFFQIRGGL